MSERKWLIWSIEHNGWWAPNSMGYVRERKDAGRYSFDDARQIVADANYKVSRPNEAMVEEEAP